MDSSDCPDIQGPAAPPQAKTLVACAAYAAETAQAATPATTASVCQHGAQDEVEAAGTECRITLRVALFFDGTGNNRDADEPTHRDSNVTRLFRAHPLDNPKDGLFKLYIPGIGTYFPEIGDPGGTATGLGMGGMGEERLGWAMNQLDQIVAGYPADKLVELRLAAFGFSRGAAEARAFAIRVADRCRRNGSQWRWDRVDMPVHFYFLGLFDTVASVGLVATGEAGMTLAVAKGWVSLDRGLGVRRNDARCGLQALAFGQPGADPTPGMNDGHMAWASDLRIPGMVEYCVNMVAGHEQRNSFPGDSVRQGAHYPANCVEMVYPGMHSDVGGGYRPGEQGRSLDRRQILAQIPLLKMYALAIEHHVPLQGISEFTDSRRIADFQVSDELQQHWQYYMDQSGANGKSLGAAMLAHSRLWYAWRFHRIRQGTGTGDDPETLPHQQSTIDQDKAFAAERAALEPHVDKLENNPARKAAQQRLAHARAALASAQQQQVWAGGSIQKKRQAVAEAEAEQARVDAPYLQAKARLDAIPSGNSVANIRNYDNNLLKDMKALLSWVKVYGRESLRPHYRMLLETYEAEFVHSEGGLRDARIIAFFDNYVHDSLAGFAKDVTLPSDPRCMYVGGDREAKYAMATQLPGQSQVQLASTRPAESATVEA